MTMVRIYRASCDKAYSIWEQGEGFSSPGWGRNTAYYSGSDDGGEDYVLPSGYELGQTVAGEHVIFKGNVYCPVVTKNGAPTLITPAGEYIRLQSVRELN